MQLTVRQADNLSCITSFEDILFYCRVGPVEFLKAVRVQINATNPAVHSLAIKDVHGQLAQKLGCLIDDLTLVHVSPDGGHSVQLAPTFLVPKDCVYLRTPPYHCELRLPGQNNRL